jgi:3,4-dihydroxy 2-butanone 4-phosphate synthase
MLHQEVVVIERIKSALADLQQGKFVLIFDDDKREGETDLVMASQFCSPQSIRQMRRDGGGLIFLMTSHGVAEQLQLPYLADMYRDVNGKYPVLKALVPDDIPYDTKSSFSLYINHRKTFTGITDTDRSLTMRSFAALIQQTNGRDSDAAVREFGRAFRSPGHVPICVAASDLLNERNGHTELVIALLEMADLSPAGSGCEMMGDNGSALSKVKAREYANRHGLVFLEGKEIVEAWKTWLP